MAEPLKPSDGVYQEALYREANLLAPCKAVSSGKHKTGSRDAAIWLTAVEYAREHLEETVYFVSANTKDFGDGTSYESPMDQDVEGLEDRFVLMTSLDDVLNKFAVKVPVNEHEVWVLLDAGRNREAAARAAETLSRERGFATASVLEGGELRRSVVRRGGLSGAVAVPQRIRDISAYEITGHTWYTATVRWLVSGLIVSMPPRVISSAWETRVLLSPTAAEQRLTIHRPGRLVAISLDDVKDLPYLPGVPADPQEWPDSLIENVLTDWNLVEIQNQLNVVADLDQHPRFHGSDMMVDE